MSYFDSQLSMNGFITCNTRYYRRYPAKLRVSWKRSIIAPFWANADSRRQKSCNLTGDSILYSDLYQNLVDKEETVPLNADPRKRSLTGETLYILARAKKDVLLRDSEFQVSWVVVATWHNMRPPPYWRNAGKVSVQSFIFIIISLSLSSSNTTVLNTALLVPYCMVMLNKQLTHLARLGHDTEKTSSCFHLAS